MRQRIHSLILVCVYVACMGLLVSAAPTFRKHPMQSTDSPVPSATIPSRRTDRNSEIAHSDLLSKAQTGVIDVYFVGDSITRRWGALDYPELLANWNENFFGWNAANFAWGGDRTENILWRLENGELDGVDPKVFIVQAGTNNLDDRVGNDAQLSAISSGVQAIIGSCLARAPDAVVVLTGVFLRSDRPSLNPIIRGINEVLASSADGEGILFLDINDRLSDAGGQLLNTMSDDGLHLSEQGYQVWADALKPVLTDLLGPPAETDLAPPPTGNPAAR